MLEQERIEVPLPEATDAGLVTQERFVEFVATERLTVLAYALTGVMVIVELPACPAFTVMLVGLADIVKS